MEPETTEEIKRKYIKHQDRKYYVYYKCSQQSQRHIFFVSLSDIPPKDYTLFDELRSTSELEAFKSWFENTFRTPPNQQRIIQ